MQAPVNISWQLLHYPRQVRGFLLAICGFIGVSNGVSGGAVTCLQNGGVYPALYPFLCVSARIAYG